MINDVSEHLVKIFCVLLGGLIIVASLGQILIRLFFAYIGLVFIMHGLNVRNSSQFFVIIRQLRNKW